MLNLYTATSGTDLKTPRGALPIAPSQAAVQAAVGLAEELRQPLLDFALAQSPAVFYVASSMAENPLEFVSANVEKITGFADLAFVQDGTLKHRRVHTDDQHDYLLWLGRLSEQRESAHEYRFEAASGKTIWFRDSARILHTSRGRKLLIGCMTEITNLKERVRALEDAIDALSDGLVLYDAEDRFVMCNAQYKAYHRESEDLLVPGAAWPEVTRARAERGLFPLANGKIEEWIAEQLAQRGIATKQEFPFFGNKWFEYSHTPTRQGGFVSTWRDITERKDMERALRQSEEMVRNVLEACPVPITMNRIEDGVIIYESPAARALLCLGEKQDGKSVLSRWVDRSDRHSYVEKLRQSGAVTGFEARLRKATGEEFWCAISSRLITYRGEEVIVSNLYDLSERREAEAELSRQREMLHQSEKLSALGELLAGVSHELNNPLLVLIGQAQMLQDSAPTKEIANRADKIFNAAERCGRIVKTFLAMARQEPGEMTLVDMNDIIEDALEITGYSLRSEGIDVSLNMAGDLPTAEADADQMRQVFTNLIVNALHALQDIAGPRRLRITSSYRKSRKRIVLKVKDNGPGIAEDIKPRIFEPFFTTKDVGSGTGIGLALCHRIVEAHGGSISVESSPGKGAAFTIKLPSISANPTTATLPSDVRHRVTASRILVVDDEHDVCQIISDILTHDGHLVDTAGSGPMALEMAKRQRYDVIISDVRMPGMDGAAFYRALSEARPELIDGLVFMTGDTLSPRVREFLDNSERPYLEKPLMARKVLELMDLLTRRKPR